MRTDIQFYMRIDEQRMELFNEYGDERSDEAANGMIAGFKWAMELTHQGKQPHEIAILAKADEENYRSWGDDSADAYQNGFTCAAFWGACQYDWDNDGYPVFIAENVFGLKEGKAS